MRRNASVWGWTSASKNTMTAPRLTSTPRLRAYAGPWRAGSLTTQSAYSAAIIGVSSVLASSTMISSHISRGRSLAAIAVRAARSVEPPWWTGTMIEMSGSAAAITPDLDGCTTPAGSRTPCATKQATHAGEPATQSRCAFRATGLVNQRRRRARFVHVSLRRGSGRPHAESSEAGGPVDLHATTVLSRGSRAVTLRLAHAGSEPFCVELRDVLDEDHDVAGGLAHSDCSKLRDGSGRWAFHKPDRRVRPHERVDVGSHGGARYDDLGVGAGTLVDDHRETARQPLRVTVGCDDDRHERRQASPRRSRRAMTLDVREPATGRRARHRSVRVD